LTNIELVSAEVLTHRGLLKSLVKKPRPVMQHFVFFLILSFTVAVAGAEESSSATQCEQNLHELSEALEKFSTKYGSEFAERDPGKYPVWLRQLAPEFFEKVPRCPNGEEYRYSNDILSAGNDPGYQAYYLIKCPTHENLGYSRYHKLCDPRTLRTPLFAEKFVISGMKRGGVDR
jgi:hypothetical protein